MKYMRASEATAELPRELEDVQGREVLSADGEKLGHVVDVLFDQFNTSYAFLETERHGFLGIHNKHMLAVIPWDQLSDNPIRVSLAAQELHGQPDYHPSMPFGDEQEMAVLGFWGVQMHEDAEATRDPLLERSGHGIAMRPEQFDRDPINPHEHYRNVPDRPY
jgi:hypothetical protein